MFNHTGMMILQATLMLVNNNNSSDNTSSTVTTRSASYSTNQDRSYGGVVGNRYYGHVYRDEEKVCYGELGCYSSTTFPWIDPKYRPVANLPMPPEEISPKYCLYTRQNIDECQELRYNDTATIYKSALIPSHKVYFISHGFLENGYKPWIKLIKARLLMRGDVNVIGVDWQGGSSPPYTQAVANIRVVGTITAHLMASLHRSVGVKTEYIHMIGHSLGAHLSGYAGSLLRTKFNLKLGRITGLDPAEPHFTQTDAIVRLDPTDAIFVDVIHTDTAPFIEGGFGISEPIGHLDFFPNGGEDQPGCNQAMKEYIKQEDGSIVKGVRRYLGCNHVRSYQYFIESLKEDCEFLAIECESYEQFKAGECFKCRSETNPEGLLCAHLGLRSIEALTSHDKGGIHNHHGGHQLKSDLTVVSPTLENRTHVKLYTITNHKYPFCRSLYRVTIKISNSTESWEHGGEVGEFSIDIDGIKARTGFIPLFREQYYKPGGMHTEVVAGKQVGRVRSATLSWHHPVSLNILTWRINTPYLLIDKVVVDNLEQDDSIELCLTVMNGNISSGTPLGMRPCRVERKHDFSPFSLS